MDEQDQNLLIWEFLFCLSKYSLLSCLCVEFCSCEWRTVLQTTAVSLFSFRRSKSSSTEELMMIFGQSRFNLFVGEQSSEIVLAEFKNKMNFGSFFRPVIRFRAADFDQLDDVFILELLQNLDFSQSSYRKAFALVFHQHLFERHYSTCYCTFRFPNFTKCALKV